MANDAPDEKPGTLQATRGFLSDVLSLLRRNLRMVVIVIAAVIFLWLLDEVAEGEILKLDTLAYRFFVEYLRSDAMTPIMEGFTSLSSVAVILVMALVVACFAPGRAPGRCVCANVIGALVINQVLKFIVQRPRPEGYRLAVETSYSFPSGHSMISMAFYGLLIWMVWKYERDNILRHVWCCLFAVIIVMVGLSRIYLGVHYASDVLAGFCVSLLWLAFFTRTIAPVFMDHEGVEPRT
jgi:membrane-associated phospholipid phosphatase